MLWFVLALFFHQSESYFSGTPQAWYKSSTKDCDQCLVERYYECGHGPCTRGVYDDHLYLAAFTDHCFGVDFLKQQAIDTFLTNFKRRGGKWRASLKVLIDVIYRSGLWTNAYFSTSTPCSPTTEAESGRAVRSITGDQSRLKVQRIKQRQGRGSKGKRYYSTQLFRCPINDSVIWREQNRYCEEKDHVIRKSDCICTSSLGVRIETKVCLDDFGYEDKSCDSKLKAVQCECPTNASLTTDSITTTMLFNNTNLPNATKRNIKTYNTSQRDTTATVTSSDVTSLVTQKGNKYRFRKNAKMVSVIIALCVVLLFIVLLVIAYCTCKIFQKRRVRTDWNTLSSRSCAQHVPSDTASQSHVVAPLGAADYFCVGDRPESSVYQTIGGRSPSVFPPVPPRLFSISSCNTVRSTSVLSRPFRQNAMSISAIAYSQPPPQGNASATHTPSSDAGYASIDGKSDERMYDLPPVTGGSLGEDTLYDLPPDAIAPSGTANNEDLYLSPAGDLYISNSSEVGDGDVRVNPLYATSKVENPTKEIEYKL